MYNEKKLVGYAHGDTPVSVPHPCRVDWNDTKNPHEHYQKLTCAQRHKCVGSYCMRKKKQQYGTEYGRPYCRFGFTLGFQSTCSINFTELETGVVCANFTIYVTIHK